MNQLLLVVFPLALLVVLELSTASVLPAREEKPLQLWPDKDPSNQGVQSEQDLGLSTNVRRARQAGNIQFEDLPTFPSVESVTEFAAHTLDSYFAMARGFIDTLQPGPLPYSLITPTVTSIAGSLFPSISNSSSGSQSGGGTPFSFASIQPVLIGIATWLVPLLILTGLGIVLAVAFPVSGLFFCCFRLCGKCGAKNYMYKQKHELPKCVTLSMIALVGFMLTMVGLLLGFLSNDKISMTLRAYPSTLNSAITDSVNYLNGTINEVTHITDTSLNTVLNQITSDVRNASTTLGDPLRSELQNDINPFLSTSETLFTNLESVRGNITGLNDTVQLITSLSTQLNANLVLLESSFANLTSQCMGNVACTSLVPSFQAADYAVNMSIDTSSLDAGLTTLDSINVSATRTLVNSYTSLFDNISTIIDQQVSNISIPIDSISSATAIVTNILGSVSQIIGSNGSIGAIRTTVDSIGATILLGEQYRNIAFIILLVGIALILVVFILGLLCGVFAYSPTNRPFERSSVSNCGARILFLGVGISFVVCGMLLVFTSLVFALSGLFQKLCNDLGPSQYVALERLVDDPEVWGGYTLVGALLRASSLNVNISIGDTLRGCESNQPLYEAAQASSFVDIDSLVSMFSNISSQLNIAGQINIGSSFTYTSDNFIPAATRQSFSNLSATISPSSLNLATVTQLLNSTSLDALDLNGLATNLTSLASAFAALGFSGAQNQTLDIRDNLLSTINGTVQSLQANISTAQGSVDSLNQTVGQIDPLVQQTFGQLDTFLNGTTPTVNNEVTEYVAQLTGYVDRFINYTVDQLTNEVGRCGTLNTVYRAVHNNICVDTVNGVNGFWFSIGWCVLFLIPILIVSAMVTTYLRKSDSRVHSLGESGKGEVVSNRQFYSRRPEEDRMDLNSPVQGW